MQITVSCRAGIIGAGFIGPVQIKALKRSSGLKNPSPKTKQRRAQILMNARTSHSRKLGSRRWTPKEVNALIEIILRYLPAIILSLAVLITACIAPGAITAGIGAIATAIKALWR